MFSFSKLFRKAGHQSEEPSTMTHLHKLKTIRLWRLYAFRKLWSIRFNGVVIVVQDAVDTVSGEGDYFFFVQVDVHREAMNTSSS